MMLLLTACVDHNVRFPGDSKPGDTDVEGPLDSETAGDTDPDTDVGPAACVASTWAWGADLTVDDADSSFLPEGDGDWAGGALGLPGDIDGDGVHDLVVGAPTHTGVAAESGKLYLLSGAPRGTGQALGAFPSFVGFEEHMQLSTIARLGDVDGDSLADFAVVPGYSWQSVWDQYIVLGTTTPRATDVDIRDADGVITETSGTVSTDFGVRDGLGDFDGDGMDDLFISDWGSNNGIVYLMTSIEGAQDVPGDATMALHGDDGTLLVDAGGDLDGDGRVDLVGTAHNGSEAISIVLGASSPPAGGTFAAAASASISDPEGGGAELLDDLDGDGTTELVTWVSNADHTDHDAYVFLGGRTAWSGALGKADASFRLTGTPALGELDTVGDLNGDGLGELAVTGGESGGPYRDIYVFFGRESWPAVLDLADADLVISAPPTSEDSMHLPTRDQQGDLNGDSIDDLLIPLWESAVEGTNGAGVVYVFVGRSSWDPLYTLDGAALRLLGSTWNQSMGSALVVEDLDGDGCDDVVASSYYHPSDRPMGSGEVFVFHGQN